MSWLQLSAGHGPGECQLAVAGLVGVLAAEARSLGLEATVLESVPGLHGPLSVLVSLSGAEQAIEVLAAGWTGTVQWTCASPLRPRWPRKNWFIGIERLRPPAPGEALQLGDLRFEAMRASGPGGQHVNKTESAVRLTHLPTGIAVVAREERSQHRNRALALARLAAALADRARTTQEADSRERWRQHASLERGNPVRRYVGLEFRQTA